MSSLRKRELNSQSWTKEAVWFKAPQVKSLLLVFSKVAPSLRMWSMAVSGRSRLISAIFWLPSLASKLRIWAARTIQIYRSYPEGHCPENVESSTTSNEWLYFLTWTWYSKLHAWVMLAYWTQLETKAYYLA